jgi:hypothetical protein
MSSPGNGLFKQPCRHQFQDADDAHNISRIPSFSKVVLTPFPTGSLAQPGLIGPKHRLRAGAEGAVIEVNDLDVPAPPLETMRVDVVDNML